MSGNDNIVFKDIPLDLFDPGVYAEIGKAQSNDLPADPTNVLIMSQRTSAGTAPAGVVTRCSRVEEAKAAFGPGSMAHLMFAAALHADPYADISVVALDDVEGGEGGGNAAMGTLEMTDSPTATGTVVLYIAGMKDIIAQTRIPLNVAAGVSQDVFHAAVIAAINARVDLPVTAALHEEEVGSKVEITAKNNGKCGNGIDIRIGYFDDEKLPAGMAITLTPMADGNGDPDVADALAAIGDTQYMAFIMPWTDSSNISTLEAELESRWGPMVRKDGTAYTALAATLSGATTWCATRNNLNMATLPVNESPTPSWIIASVLGTVCERERAKDPGLHLRGVEMPGVMLPIETLRFTGPERNMLLKNGLSAYTTTRDGRMLLARVVSNYQTDSFDFDDDTFMDITQGWAAAYIRYQIVVGLNRRAGRKKLAKRNDIPNTVTLGDIRGYLLVILDVLEGDGIVRDVAENEDGVKVVESSQIRGRVNIILPAKITPNIYTFAAAIGIL